MPPSSIAGWRTVVALTVLTVAGCTPAATVTAPALDGTKCRKDELATLYPGILTFGADQPVYPPWYLGDDPTNGEGFESALAYAVAAELSYSADDVRWVRVPFNAALAPGPKTFDANLSQFSITEQRRAAVDFSAPYFDVTQAVVTVRTSPAATARTLDDLRGLRLGAQVGSTSHSAATTLETSTPVEVYNTNVDAKMALVDGKIDAMVADLPTAFAVANELNGGVMIGQLPDDGGPDQSGVEQFGIVLDHGSSLTRCVSWAVDSLRDDGTLALLQQRWLADAGRAPVLS
ncbi:ABC transporter substrate-binding protein [Mycolicibacterium sp. BiH015]|uniref:ABC transporter substrate-binding protein n=1 Tax=Mycolicibacterium sp. BiH015 TaxID=3018808 RepID=UPI0022E28CB8|nr:ABC transporter substrate-binding protein [Mycolicibacterium sp. BiH015]MDA2889505.1 ABC transporter substrate-binding protein [Mycolicibacterium sp. BiH015]